MKMVYKNVHLKYMVYENIHLRYMVMKMVYKNGPSEVHWLYENVNLKVRGS